MDNYFEFSLNQLDKPTASFPLLSIDIGGTSISWLKLNSAHPSELDPSFINKHSFEKGLGNIQATINEIIETETGCNSISLCMPGKFDTNNCIIPKTAANIELVKNELTNVPVTDFFPKSVSSKPIYIINDALSQCLGHVMDYQSSHSVTDQLIVFLGIGTGLGGGLGLIQGDQFILLEDSHVFDFPIQHSKTKAFVNAESIISGKALSRIFADDVSHVLATKRLYERYETHFDFMVYHLCLLMTDLSAHMRRLFHTNADISFLIGGSIGTNPKIKEKIQETSKFTTHFADNADLNAHIGNMAFQEILSPVTINLSNQC